MMQINSDKKEMSTNSTCIRIDSDILEEVSQTKKQTHNNDIIQLCTVREQSLRSLQSLDI